MQSTSKNKLIGLLLLSSSTAFGGDHYMSVTSNISYKTDYVFRGISQTKEIMAVQGGFDLSTNNGAYLGTWASNVNFGDSSESNIEVDLYGGFGGELSNELKYDVGLIGYYYPGTESAYNYNFGEIYGSLSRTLYGEATGTLSYNYSPEYFSDTGDASYYHMSITAPTSVTNLSVSGGWGYQTINDDTTFGTGDYQDYTVAAAYEMKKVTLGLAFHDTFNCDASDSSARFVASMSASF